MNMTNIRIRYTQILLICLLCISLHTMFQSLSKGFLEFEENFWHRTFMINSFTELKLKLGDQVFLQTVVGKQGWWEFTNDNNLDDYQNVMTIPPSGLKVTQQKLKKLYQKLREKNITLIFFIAPNKATIYPDRVPNEIQKIGPQSNLDAFTAYVKKNGPPVLLDLRPALMDGRKKWGVYYKTDTHWNNYGGFVAYTEIIKELSKTYPQLSPKSISDFIIKPSKPEIQPITHIAGAISVLEPHTLFIPKDKGIEIEWATFSNEQFAPVKVSTTSNTTLPTLLMYMDSFGPYMESFLPFNFRKATFIRHNSKYKDTVSLKAIDIIDPDVVIIEVVERFFSNQRLDNLLDRLNNEKSK